MWYSYKGKIVNLSKIDIIKTSENACFLKKYEIIFILLPNGNTVETFYFETESQRDIEFASIVSVLKAVK